MTHLEKVYKELAPESALLVKSEINQRWLTDFDFTDGYVLVCNKNAYLITDFRYIEAAKNECAEGFEVLLHSGDLLGDVKAKLDGVELKGGASSLLDNLRRYKDESEFERIKAAQAITDAAFDHILGYINPDRTEVDVALELEFFMRKMGAESTAFQTIAVSGTASSMPHGVPRNVKLERGFLTMDFGAKYKGYCSDMTRTVVIGKADADMKRVYDTVLQAQLAAIDAVREGMTGSELDRIARDIIYGAGYEGCFGHGLGHGVGLLIHEPLRISAFGKKPLEKGHVFTVEPGIYLKGKYGVRIEDMIQMTENGPLDITKSPKDLIEII